MAGHLTQKRGGKWVDVHGRRLCFDTTVAWSGLGLQGRDHRLDVPAPAGSVRVRCQAAACAPREGRPVRLGVLTGAQA